MGNAIGLLEVQGFSVALAAMDKACKAANVVIEGIDCNNPATGDNAPIPVVVQVKFTGTVSDVRVGLDAARAEAIKHIAENDILTHFIPASVAGIEKLLPIGKVSKKS
ncbi:BMC domain-containing protein [Radiobacillus sp. PE A8.2]|uniref:BMC domain-containing protein n=1 Tax=Radiobacillus sp. PE A8.2 TaxID=3380349 RepID=UPI00389001AD